MAPTCPAHTAGVADITCPFTGETLTAVAALRPDVTVIHAQRADRLGNVQYWGITGVQKEAVLAATRSIVTVEEIVDELDPRPGAVVLPSWSVTHVAVVPGGAHPSYALDYSVRDNDFYVAWDAISRDRTSFQSLDGRARLRRGRDGHTEAALTYTSDEMMTVTAARALRDRMTCFVGHRAAERGREPGPGHARAEPGADLRVGHHRRQARRAAAVDRRRHPGPDR